MLQQYTYGNWNQKPTTHCIAIKPNDVQCSIYHVVLASVNHTLIARFMGPTWHTPGADRTQVGPMLAPWTLLSGYTSHETVSSDINQAMPMVGQESVSYILIGFVSKQPNAIRQIAIDLPGLPYIDLSYVDQRPYQLKHPTLSMRPIDEWIPWLCILHHWTSVVSFDKRAVFPWVFAISV